MIPIKQSKLDMLDAVENYYAISDNPVHGPIYIMPDGVFLDLSSREPTGEDFMCHADVDNVVTNLGFGPYKGAYDSGSEAMRELNCIRCNDIELENHFIELPKNRPTPQQFDSLEKWLYFTKDVYVIICTDNFEDCNKYYYEEYLPEDMIKRIKRYYASGILYEDK